MHAQCIQFESRVPMKLAIKTQPGHFHCNPFILQSRITTQPTRKQHQNECAVCTFLNAVGTFNSVLYHFNWICSAFPFCYLSVDIVYIYCVIKSLMIYFYTLYSSVPLTRTVFEASLLLRNVDYTVCVSIFPYSTSKNGIEMAKFNKCVWIWIPNGILLNNWILGIHHTHTYVGIVYTWILDVNFRMCVSEYDKITFWFHASLFVYYGLDGIQSQSLLGSWITKSPRDYDDAMLLVVVVVLWLLLRMASGMILSVVRLVFFRNNCIYLDSW